MRELQNFAQSFIYTVKLVTSLICLPAINDQNQSQHHATFYYFISQSALPVVRETATEQDEENKTFEKRRSSVEHAAVAA